MHATIAEEEGQDLKEENIFVQNGTRGGVNRSYVLLDNQSTVNQIANPSLLAKIRKTKNRITVHCNNGLSYTNLEGDLGGMTMYHNLSQPIRDCKRLVAGINQGQAQSDLR